MKSKLSTHRKIAAVVLGSALATTVAAPVRAAASPVAAALPQAAVIGTPATLLDPALTHVRARPAIPFKPFVIRDPKTGQPVSPDTILTLRNGKKIKGSDYIAEIYRLEKGFNAMGYSLQDPAPVILQETLTDPAALDSQARAIAAEHKPADPKAAVTAPSFQDLENQHRLLLGQDATRLQQINQIVGAKAHVAAVPPLRAVPVVAITPTGTFSQSNSWDYHLGSPSTLYAFLNGRQDLNGNANQTTLSAQAKAGGAIVNYSFDLVRASGFLSSYRSGQEAAQLKLYVVGFGDILNLNQSANASWSKSDGISRPVDVHTTFHFTLGPIPIGVTLGARGTVGLNYWIGLRPAAVNCGLWPYVRADAYGQAGVDIGVASAGVGGSFTLLNDWIILHGDCSVGADARGLYIDANYSAFNVLKMLAGRIYAYVEVDLLFWSKRWEHDFFNWSGFTVTGNIFNSSRRQYL